MGCVFSCFRADDDDEEQENSEHATDGHCNCLTCLTLTQQFFASLLQRGEAQVTPSVTQVATFPSVSADEDSSIPDTYHAPPRPLPYDDPRCSMLHSKADKPSSHCHEHSGKKHKGLSNLCLSDSTLRSSSKEDFSEVAYINAMYDAEDECPTCLEGYTSENPKMTMQCAHHFHLSCIYEWMERSEACPVCGKVMLFNETN